MTNIAKFLEALPSAATNSYAFLGYALTIAAWLIIAWRTARSRQLLAHLGKVPEKDRAKIIRDEMGVVPIREDLSPEQWLRSRIHTYYFAGFVTVCVAAVIVIIIALTKPVAGTGVLPAKSSEDTSAIKLEENKWQYARVGAQRSFVESHLGPPQFEERGKKVVRANYRLDFYYLQIVYGPDSRVLQFSVTSLNAQFHPSVPNWPFGELILGKFKFSDLEDKTTPEFFDYSSKDWFYVEGMEGSGATDDRSIFLSYSDYGKDYCPDSGPMAEGMVEALLAATEEKFKLTPDIAEKLRLYRSKTCPNSFAVRADIQDPDVKNDEENDELLLLPVIDRVVVYEMG